jgi:hypothetical protein
MKERLEMDQTREEVEIISMDTSNMPPMRQKYFHLRQMEIIEKLRTK